MSATAADDMSFPARYSRRWYNRTIRIAGYVFLAGFMGFLITTLSWAHVEIESSPLLLCLLNLGKLLSCLICLGHFLFLVGSVAHVLDSHKRIRRLRSRLKALKRTL